MRKFLFIALLTGFLIPAALPQTWEPVGPEGGSFCGVVVDPVDPDTITIVGASPSPPDVYRSTDGGASWSIIGSVGSGVSVGVFAYYDFNTLFAIGYDSTYTYTVYKSTDGGASWTAAGTPFGAGYANALCVHPTDPNTIFAGGYLFDYGTYTYTGKFWATTDGGATWTETDLPDGIYDGAIVTGMGVAPTNPNNMMITGYQYDASYNYFALTWQSLDGGATWTDISAQVDPDAYGEMWAVMYDPTDENIIHGGGWYYTHSTWDGGATWTRHTMEMLGADGGAIDPVDTNNVYVTNGGNVYKSIDQGHTWTDITGPGGYAGGFVVHPVQNDLLYAANPYGGHYRSMDYGQTWASAHTGIMAASLTCVGTAPSAPDMLFGTTLGGQMFGSYDNCGNLVELTYPPDCTVGNFSDILVCSTDSDIVMGLAVG